MDCKEQRGVAFPQDLHRNLLGKGFKPLLPKLCQRHSQDIYGGNLAANSFAESENTALKKDTMGPRPNQSIDTSHEVIWQHEQQQLVRLRTTAL
jgi:hypothetical protein